MTDPVTPDPRSDGTVSEELRDAPIDPLEELFIEVNALATRLHQGARRGQLADDLPAGGTHVLRTLSSFGSLTVPQIARANSTSRQNIQTIVNRLAREGCVELIPNPAHKRSELVRLTELGQASVEAVARHEEGYKERVLGYVSKEDLVRSSKTLRSIREVLIAPRSPEIRIEPSEANRILAKRKSESLEIRQRAHKTVRAEPEKRAFETNELPVNLL